MGLADNEMVGEEIVSETVKCALLEAGFGPLQDGQRGHKNETNDRYWLVIKDLTFLFLPFSPNQASADRVQSYSI